MIDIPLVDTKISKSRWH